jgi:hypothetical protein
VREAILLLTLADRAPEAAAVNGALAGLRAGAHTAVAELLDAPQLASVMQEADAISITEVLDSVRQALLELAHRPRATARSDVPVNASGAPD